MNERIRQFDEQENQRIKAALDEHEAKCAKKIQVMKEKHLAAVFIRNNFWNVKGHFQVKELEDMQNEKRKQLLEKESLTMSEHEKKYYEMREQWKADLVPRKAVWLNVSMIHNKIRKFQSQTIYAYFSASKPNSPRNSTNRTPSTACPSLKLTNPLNYLRLQLGFK